MGQAIARKIGSIAVGVGCLLGLALAAPSNASAVTVLPDPTSTFDGIPVAIQYDQFVSYAAKLLDKWGFPGFDVNAGTGGLDVILMTGAGGADNNTVAGGIIMEDPAPSPTGSGGSFSDTWGAGLRTGGPQPVDEILTYLHNQFGPTTSIPVFTFDMNEPGNDVTEDLFIHGRMYIYDSGTDTEIASWAFDNIANGTLDVADYVLAEGTLSVTSPLFPFTVYTVHNNIGSGKVDFILYAPTMDLSLYAGHPTYQFRAFFEMTDLDNGFEEAYISGGFTPQQPPCEGDECPCTGNDCGGGVIPEPGSLLLLGSGLGLLAVSHRRRRLS